MFNSALDPLLSPRSALSQNFSNVALELLRNIQSHLDGASLACLSICCRSLHRDVSKDKDSWMRVLSRSPSPAWEVYISDLLLIVKEEGINDVLKMSRSREFEDAYSNMLFSRLKYSPHRAVCILFMSRWYREERTRLRARRLIVFKKISPIICFTINFIRFLFVCAMFVTTLMLLYCSFVPESFVDAVYLGKEYIGLSIIVCGVLGTVLGSVLWSLSLPLDVIEYRTLLRECVGFWTSWGYSLPMGGRTLQLVVSVLAGVGWITVGVGVHLWTFPLCADGMFVILAGVVLWSSSLCWLSATLMRNAVFARCAMLILLIILCVALGTAGAFLAQRAALFLTVSLITFMLTACLMLFFVSCCMAYYLYTLEDIPTVVPANACVLMCRCNILVTCRMMTLCAMAACVCLMMSVSSEEYLKFALILGIWVQIPGCFWTGSKLMSSGLSMVGYIHPRMSGWVRAYKWPWWNSYEENTEAMNDFVV